MPKDKAKRYKIAELVERLEHLERQVGPECNGMRSLTAEAQALSFHVQRAHDRLQRHEDDFSQHVKDGG